MCVVLIYLWGIVCQKVEEELRRQLAIGYLPNIKKLNGSTVSVDERDKAHRVLVRHYMNCDEKPARLVIV